MIHGIHHIQITVPPDTLEAAREFYVDRLGFTTIADPFNKPGFWLAAGAQQVHVRPEADIDRHKTFAHPAFLVTGLSDLETELRRGGFVIDPQPDFDGYTRLHVIDPGGNRIELMQRVAEVGNA